MLPMDLLLNMRVVIVKYSLDGTIGDETISTFNILFFILRMVDVGDETVSKFNNSLVGDGAIRDETVSKLNMGLFSFLRVVTGNGETVSKLNNGPSVS